MCHICLQTIMPTVTVFTWALKKVEGLVGAGVVRQHWVLELLNLKPAGLDWAVTGKPAHSSPCLPNWTDLRAAVKELSSNFVAAVTNQGPGPHIDSGKYWPASPDWGWSSGVGSVTDGEGKVESGLERAGNGADASWAHQGKIHLGWDVFWEPAGRIQTWISGNNWSVMKWSHSKSKFYT